jgi:hypothetical protein
MRITRETLLRIAKETAQKRALSDPGLVAAYLTGSLRSDNPFIGNATDIDIIMVHAEHPKVHREIAPLTPEIHLDIVHRPRSDYDKPKELRVHPWLGPEIYDPQPLYVTQHFFEFVQAGVRDKYHEPASVLTRARRTVEEARQGWSALLLSQTSSPELLNEYLKTVNQAANAVALLTGGPLAERRFLLQFPGRAEAAGKPELTARLLNLLGAGSVSAETLAGFLPEWQKAFLEAAGNPQVDGCIATARLGYYKLAFEALLASETPQAVVWPLIHTWTLSVAILSPTWKIHWRSACETFGLDEGAFDARLEELDQFLDIVEEMLDALATSQGL